ncbi:hypothetical protein GCM10011571_22400 [Marinithermofilum abyssi]|uniref:Uncharacterized protein n=1 Tax=Marinithermofilum abyssi TaxID=1571185 RepID=A0A8J2VI25_9BACL|nr:hypothetical protein [Marinithermofilum abyssi]GGE19969.1 hypothetical protein GCM10011571_22400 [Marinithermofilum abyssi]
MNPTQAYMRYTTMEIRGEWGHLVYLDLESPSLPQRLRAKVNKEGCWTWEIHVLKEIPIDNRSCKGWMFAGKTRSKATALNTARDILMREWIRRVGRV